MRNIATDEIIKGNLNRTKNVQADQQQSLLFSPTHNSTANANEEEEDIIIVKDDKYESFQVPKTFMDYMVQMNSFKQTT